MKKLVLILMVLVFVLPTFAQDEGENAPDISPLLLEQLESLDVLTSEMRELETLTSVDKYFPTPEELSAFVYNDVAEELTDEVIREATLFYRGLDFVDADFDLLNTYLALLEDQIAGFYDPESNEMNVILIDGGKLGDRLPALEQVTYVHEYVHALQDQHFDLMVMQDALPEDNYDMALALTSLIEGDATSAMNQFTLEVIVNDPEALMEILSMDLSDTEMPEGTPAILEEELLTPYLAGAIFVDALRAKGGWQAINEAFANPPVSMEQIFHPEKYFAGELPVEVVINDVMDAFDAGWELVAERTLGEFYLSQYLQNELNPSVAERAAAGWGGDRFGLYYSADTDQVGWVLVIAWDTPEDAAEFSAAFGEYASARGGTMDGACWTTEGDALCMSAEDTRAVIALAPSASVGEAMIGAQ